MQDYENRNQPENTDTPASLPNPQEPRPQDNGQTVVQNGPYGNQDGQNYQNGPYGPGGNQAAQNNNGSQNYQNDPYGSNGNQAGQNNPYGRQNYQNDSYGSNGNQAGQNNAAGNQGYQNNPYGKQGYQNSPYGGQGYQNNPNGGRPYGNVPQPKNKNGFANGSLLCGIFGLLSLCCCAFPLAIVMGVGAISFAFISKKNQPFSGPAIAGIILGIFCILLGIGEFIYVMVISNLMKDPEYASMFDQIYKQLEQQLQQMK